MVTPLKNRASDEQRLAAHLHYSAAWDTTDTSIADARAAVRALLADAATLTTGRARTLSSSSVSWSPMPCATHPARAPWHWK